MLSRYATELMTVGTIVMKEIIVKVIYHFPNIDMFSVSYNDHHDQDICNHFRHVFQMLINVRTTSLLVPMDNALLTQKLVMV